MTLNWSCLYLFLLFFLFCSLLALDLCQLDIHSVDYFRSHYNICDFHLLLREITRTLHYKSPWMDSIRGGCKGSNLPLLLTTRWSILV